MKKRKEKSMFGSAECYPIPTVDKCTFDLVEGIATGRMKIQPDKNSLNEAWIALGRISYQIEKMGFVVKDVIVKELIHHVTENAAGYVGMTKEEAIAGLITRLYESLRKRCLDLSVVVFDDNMLTWQEQEEEENLK